jgi:hypothetical protein
MIVLSALGSAKTEVSNGFVEVCKYGFVTYKDLLFGIAIGMFLAWGYHFFIGNRLLKKSYETLLKAKDETISAYKALVLERLEKVDVDPKSEGFFKKVKNFFKN